MQGRVLNSTLYVTFRCDNNLISIVLDVSASEVEPTAVVAPFQSRSQAADEKSEQNVKEEKLLTGSKGEMGQAVANESPEHLCEF